MRRLRRFARAVRDAFAYGYRWNMERAEQRALDARSRSRVIDR